MHLRWMVNLFLVLFNDCRWAMTNWKDVLTLRLLASTPAFFQPSHCIWEVCDWMWPGRRVIFCFLKLILGLCYVELQLFDEEKKKNLCVTSVWQGRFLWLLAGFSGVGIFYLLNFTFRFGVVVKLWVIFLWLVSWEISERNDFLKWDMSRWILASKTWQEVYKRAGALSKLKIHGSRQICKQNVKFVW